MVHVGFTHQTLKVVQAKTQGCKRRAKDMGRDRLAWRIQSYEYIPEGVTSDLANSRLLLRHCGSTWLCTTCGVCSWSGGHQTLTLVRGG